jgi:iron complex outermembrane receptor protein
MMKRLMLASVYRSSSTIAHSNTIAACALGSMLCALPATAQTTDTTRTKAPTQTLQPVTVTVTRDAARSVLELPFALTRITPDSLHPGLRRTSLGELLLGIPGVQVQDRNNPSQDPRLAVRGFGARSAFGVRGVRVIRDGIPLTLPDGQTPIDWLDTETAGSVEAIRGTAAALYGNASGGVVSITSRAPDQSPLAISARGWSGGNVARGSVMASGSGPERVAGVTESGYLVSVTNTQGDGPREYSKQNATSAFVRALGTIGHTKLELQGTDFDEPTAQNPGALTAAELSRDPQLADSANIKKFSRKAVQQKQIALIATQGMGATSITATLFAGTRNLDNPLPFSIVAVDRSSYGGSVRAGTQTTLNGLPVRMTAGFDTQTQNDHRYNFANCSDVTASNSATTTCPNVHQARGAVSLDQGEDVSGQGAFARWELEVPRTLLGSVALRYDRVNFNLLDHYIVGTNGDDSGERSMTAFSPMVGLVWRVKPLVSLYVNAASAFETPTITELTNQPDGKLGLNQDLQPQRTQTLEVGVQSIIGAHLKFDGAIFGAIAQHELVGFDVPGVIGRRAYRNSGKTRRQGLEANLQYVGAWGEAGGDYTLSRFRFVNYSVGTANYAGNVIPGVPVHQGQAFVNLRSHGWYFTTDANSASRVSAADAANVYASAWTIFGMRVGRAPGAGKFGLEPTFGVDNIFNRTYASSVVINATRSRYFEPGFGRRVFAGLKVSAAPWGALR